MSDLRRVSAVAILFAVLVRMAIGWQFFYEGLWKHDSQNTAKPWTSAGYLANARGPLRDHFRGMVPDPDGLNWLDYGTVNDRWVAWEEQFTEHYELDEATQERLRVLLDGPDEIVGKSRFPKFADGIKIGGKFAREKIIVARKDSKNRFYLVIDGKKHLLPSERSALLRDGLKVEAAAKKKMKAAEKAGDQRGVDVAQRQADLAVAFNKAVADVYKRNTSLGFREQLLAMLIGDPERVAQIHKDQPEGSVDHKRPAKTEEYRNRLVHYEALLADATQDFKQEHLDGEAARIRTLRAELLGPVQKLEADVKRKANTLLTEEQLAVGPIPAPPLIGDEGLVIDELTIQQIDTFTMWALMALGGLLIVGLFSRITAFLGAGLILSFYLVMPPWPGVPAAPGPEHSLFINKNLIEVFALFMLAAIPTGKWFGLDAFWVWLFAKEDSRGNVRRSRGKSVTSTSSLSPAERVVKLGAEIKEAEKKEPVAAKDTYTIKPGKKSK